MDLDLFFTWNVTQQQNLKEHDKQDFYYCNSTM